MIDIKFIRENVEQVKKASVDKHIGCDVDRLLAVDQRRRELQVEIEALRSQIKENGQVVGLLRNPKSPGYQRANAVLQVLFCLRLVENPADIEGLNQRTCLRISIATA